MRIEYLLKNNSKCTSGQPGCKFQANSAFCRKRCRLLQRLLPTRTVPENSVSFRSFRLMSVYCRKMSMLGFLLHFRARFPGRVYYLNRDTTNISVCKGKLVM